MPAVVAGALQLYQPQLSRTLAQKQSSWTEQMDLLAAVRLDDEVTVAITIPDNSALARYVALGDASGKLYVFSSSGRLQAEISMGKPVLPVGIAAVGIALVSMIMLSIIIERT